MHYKTFLTRRFLLFAIIIALALAIPLIALADNVVNDVVVAADSTFTLGGSSTVHYRITATGGDGQAGCNASDGSSAKVTINVPAGVTATPSLLTFTTCGVGSAQTVVFTSTIVGDFPITVSVADSGTGTYNTTPANFTLHVLAPTDSTPPVITPNVSGTPGSNGWYVSDVTVTFSVTDDESTVTSKSADCDATSTVNADTAGVTFTCTATSAGGTSSQSVTIKRDASAPSIGASPSPGANANGWNNTDVTVSYSCSDNGPSGIDLANSDYGNDVLTASGTATGTCVDNAGNSASASYDAYIDKDAPSISASGAPAPNANGWNNTDVTVSYSCSDANSGVDAGASDLGDDTLTATGTATGTCVDNAGNSASASYDANIDKDAPSITVSATPAPNANGWNNTDVTVSYSCSDGGSGIDDAASDDADDVLSASGTAMGTCVDLAGNSASDTYTAQIDKDAPSISASGAPAPNANGWNNTDVTVSYSCSDGGSGIDVAASDYGDDTLTASGTASGTCVDQAGNSASASYSALIDKDAPSISASGTPAPNANGWNNTDVTVSYSCSDNGLSGIDGGASDLGDDTLTATGTASGTCVDLAGNSASASYSALIDKDAPSISASGTPAPNVNGWNNTDVTVSYSCSDANSGVDGAASELGDDTLTATGTASGTCVDLAGNSASASYTAQIDKVAPVISATPNPFPNSNGWNNTDVTVSYSCSDSNSGVDAAASDLGSDLLTATGTASGTCVDHAGNSASANYLAKIDKVAPLVALNTTITNGATYYFGSVPPEPTCTASDALSGLDGACTVFGYDTTVGTHTVTAVAADKAGNSATDSRTYTVLAWTLKGFYQPVDMNGIFNTVKAGSTVPLKFEVFAGDTELTNTDLIIVSAKAVSCSSSSPEDAIEVTATGGTSLRYDTTAGQFIYNWQTPKTAGKCYAVTVTTVDGSKLTAYFKLK